MQGEPDNPVAIVTGAGTGIGAACAQALANRGYRIAVNFNRSQSEAERTVTRCRETGAASMPVQGNIANDEDCRRIVATTVDEWGGIDLLVNNAGITCYADQDDLEALSKDDFENIMSVNVSGTFEGFGQCRRGQYFVSFRVQRNRFLDGLCRFEGRAQHDDAVARAQPGAIDSSQRGLPRVCRYRLDVGKTRRAGIDSIQGQGRGDITAATSRHRGRCCRGSLLAWN